jgi:hypothetical protein
MPKNYRLPVKEWTGRFTIGGETVESGGAIIGKFSWDENAAPEFKAAKSAYMAAISAVDGVRSKRQKLIETKKYTPEGIKQKLGRIAVDDEVISVRKAAVSAENLRKAIAARKSNLTLPPIDRTDVVAEMQRAEMRAQLRTKLASLSAKERSIYLIENKTPALLSAVLNADPSLSGIPESTYSAWKQDEIQKLHGDAIEELSEMEQAVKTAEIALSAAREKVREEIGLNKQEFDHLVAPAEKAAGTLKFVRTREEVNGVAQDVVRVVDPVAGVMRLANEEELEQFNRGQ